jgi:membrane protein involved in colicin uptake
MWQAEALEEAVRIATNGELARRAEDAARLEAAAAKAADLERRRVEEREAEQRAFREMEAVRIAEDAAYMAAIRQAKEEAAAKAAQIRLEDEYGQLSCPHLNSTGSNSLALLLIVSTGSALRYVATRIIAPRFHPTFGPDTQSSPGPPM